MRDGMEHLDIHEHRHDDAIDVVRAGAVSAGTPATTSAEAMVQVTRGHASAEEVAAAITALLAARRAAHGRREAEAVDGTGARSWRRSLGHGWHPTAGRWITRS